jgi:hypothetical protein
MNSAFRNAILVSTLGLAALVTGCCDKTKNLEAPITTVTVIPTARVERSGAAHYSNGSYTFPYRTADGREGCAYRDGSDTSSGVQSTTNRILEYESMCINQAFEKQKEITFTPDGKTPEGCYEIKEWNNLGQPRDGPK